MANRLARETSPYLLQHSENPVDWYPWGEEAMGRAREEDLPILLSVGYSACHWCHVMERESFEDAETAAYMNEHFVNVKVDREERPDVDAIYMEAVQAISGQGGWPMTVFLDPDGVPFYGGTYFPPDESRGMPSFRMVMEAVVDAFERKRDEIRERAGETRARLGAVGAIEPAGPPPEAEMLEQAVERLLRRRRPRARRVRRRAQVPAGLGARAAHGSRLGGGEDAGERWRGRRADPRRDDGRRHLRPDRRRLRPLLRRRRLARPPLREDALRQRAARPRLPARLAGARPRPLPARLRRDARLDAARDARARGRLLLGARRRLRGRGGPLLRLDPGADPRRRSATRDGRGARIEHYGRHASERQLRGRQHPAPAGRRRRRSRPERFDEARRALYEARAKRVWPGLDDKRLASWNALAIAALAEAGAVLGREDYLDAARECAEFVLGSMRDEEGRLLRTYKDGRAHLNGYLEDHAFLLEALLALYEATFEPRWFEQARALAETTIERFGDPERGGFFTTSDDHEELIARRKEIGDHPIPSGNSSAALGLLRLARADRRALLRAPGRGRAPALRQPRRPAPRGLRPPAAGARLPALADPRGRPGPARTPSRDSRHVVRAGLRPHLVLAGGAEGASVPPLLADRPAVDGRPTAYVCERFACQAPVTEAKSLSALL